MFICEVSQLTTCGPLVTQSLSGLRLSLKPCQQAAGALGGDLILHLSLKHLNEVTGHTRNRNRGFSIMQLRALSKRRGKDLSKMVHIAAVSAESRGMP